jgi:predicted nucleic acid-binding protein
LVPVLVDSSLWVHQLRKGGDPAKRQRVNALLEAGEAAWCAPVRLELWRGVTTDVERKTLRRYEALLPDYEITVDTWAQAMRLADRDREAGITAPLAELLIFAARRSTSSRLHTTTSISTRWRRSRRSTQAPDPVVLFGTLTERLVSITACGEDSEPQQHLVA